MSNDGWLPLTIDGGKHFVRVREGKAEHRTEAEHARRLHEEWTSIAARTNHAEAVKRIYDSAPRDVWPLGLRVLSEFPHVRAEWVDPIALPMSVALRGATLGDVDANLSRASPSFMTYARAAVYHMPDYPASAMRQLCVSGVRRVPHEATVCAVVCAENRLLVFMRATRVPTNLPAGAARATVIDETRRQLAREMEAIQLPVLDGVEAAVEPGWFESDVTDDPPRVHMYASIGRHAVTAHNDECSPLTVNLPGASVSFATFAPRPAAGALPTMRLESVHRSARA